MNPKRIGRVLLVAAAAGSLPLAAFADEIVHFTNGAEMTVRSHVVEKEKDMVKLDLGGNSFIAFPMAMVDKIVSSGKDVFLNPVFHPSNQAIAGGTGTAIADTSTRGTGDPTPGTRKAGAKVNAGASLGEASGVQAIPAGFGQIEQQSVAQSRKVFNPAFPPAPGSAPQVIMPPNSKAHAAVPMTSTPTRPAPPPVTPPAPPPATSDPPENNPPPSDPPEDPPDTP